MRRRSQWIQLSVAVGILLAASSLAQAQNLTSAQLDAVKARLAEGATHSWEIGTRAQALIEYDTPAYSVLNSSALPPSQDQAPSSLDEVVSIARSAVKNLTSSGVQGPQPLVDATGGAAGDPPSIGVAVLLANWTGAGAQDDLDYAGAAEDQLEFLLQKVPRTSDGAISHRTEQVELWSDFVYMVPPFLAYYGVLVQNQSLVQAAYDQCRLYRQYLVDDSAGGMWRHIALGSNTDNGHWTTGNGWAAAGMLRVLGTIQHSQYAKSMKNQAKDLTNWINQIHTGIYPYLQSSGLFKNYADDDSSFEDASGTAVIASTVYRLALLTGIHTHLPAAEQSRTALSAPAPSNNSALAHFTADMWLQPVVNPDSVGSQGSHSPEGQAFVVEMYAAYRDWAALGSPGQNAASPTRPVGVRAAGAACLAALAVAFTLIP